MVDTRVDPSKTLAMVVGVEAYDTGAKPLDGPVPDGLRFVNWLRARGVPDENLLGYFSPIEKNRLAVERCGLPTKPATQAHIMEAVQHILPERTADLFFLFWGGHGVVPPSQDRRLFFSDIGQAIRPNLNLDSVLASLRTSIYQKLPRQILIVDACSNFVDQQVQLPDLRMAMGAILPNPQQYILFAAGPGEFAHNDTAEQAGYFSREVLSALEAAPMGVWPPDMHSVEMTVQKRFRDILTGVKWKQTPVSVQFTDWGHNVRTFVSTPALSALLSRKEVLAGVALTTIIGSACCAWQFNLRRLRSVGALAAALEKTRDVNQGTEIIEELGRHLEDDRERAAAAEVLGKAANQKTPFRDVALNTLLNKMRLDSSDIALKTVTDIYNDVQNEPLKNRIDDGFARLLGNKDYRLRLYAIIADRNTPRNVMEGTVNILFALKSREPSADELLKDIVSDSGTYIGARQYIESL